MGASQLSDEGWTVGFRDALDAETRGRAVRAVAHHALNAAEAVMFLSMLGLTAGEGVEEGNAA
jgi:hypothetical protein